MTTIDSLRRTLIAALALVCLLSATAVADYDSREREATSKLADVDVTEQERDVLEEALDDYFDARGACLGDLLDVLGEDDADPQADAYSDRAASCAEEGSKILGDAVEDLDEPSVAALGFINVFRSHEAAFMGGLGGLRLASGRDAIVATRIRVVEMTGVLDEKWNGILENEETIHKRAKALAEKIESDLDEAIRRSASARESFTETFVEITASWAESPTAPTPTTGDPTIDQAIGLLKGALGHSLRWWQNFDTRTELRISTYEGLIETETRIIVMFGNVREDVAEFLEETNMPQAEAALTAARESADEWVGGAKTSGQEDDAEEFRDAAMELVAARFDETADAYDEFVAAHEEKFFGALGPEVKAQVLRPEYWSAFTGDIEAYSIDAKLRKWRSQATNYFEVDLGDVPDEARRELKNGLEGLVDHLADAYDDARKAQDTLIDTLEEGREDLEDELD